MTLRVVDLCARVFFFFLGGGGGGGGGVVHFGLFASAPKKLRQ